MGSQIETRAQPHAVCIPFPAQGHITPMLKLAKLLHHNAFHITFVNTDYNQARLLKLHGLDALQGLPSFQFRTIHDGLPQSDASDDVRTIPALCASTSATCLGPLRELLAELNADDGVPPVSCLVADGIMSFTVEAADEMGIPVAVFWTTSACGYYAYMQYEMLIQKGYVPLKDASDLTNGYLSSTIIDDIPGMKDIRLKDFPSFVRTTNLDDFKFILGEIRQHRRASGIILNTFEDLEKDILEELSSFLPPVYAVGPLNLLQCQVSDPTLEKLRSSLWKEELDYIEWLDSKPSNSVVYVNFGSITVMTHDQLVEFAWGLANSNQSFLWIIRPHLVSGDNAILPTDFLETTMGRGKLASWCSQEKVLEHTAVGGFLTHCGWNSTLESLSAGVPMICWPFFADQQTNCFYSCARWGVGMEIDSDVKRDAIESLVRELMEGEKGEELKRRAGAWKKLAHASAEVSSCQNLQKFINHVLLSQPSKV